MFNRGDKVRIKDLVVGQHYGKDLIKYPPILKQYANQVFTIDLCYEDNRYTVVDPELENEEIDEIFLTPVIEKLKELKLGDIATTDCGEKIVFFRSDGSIDKFGDISIYEVTSNEENYIKDSMPEIEKIERNGEVIYTNVREMTLEEVEKELGYKVVIVDA